MTQNEPKRRLGSTKIRRVRRRVRKGSRVSRDAESRAAKKQGAWRGQLARRGQLDELSPVAFLPVPAVAVVHPAAVYPRGTRMRASFPSARAPDIVVGFPAIVAVNPNEVRPRRGSDDLDLRSRGPAGHIHDAGRRRRREACRG
jgi:hypothetical protein